MRKHRWPYFMIAAALLVTFLLPGVGYAAEDAAAAFPVSVQGYNCHVLLTDEEGNEISTTAVGYSEETIQVPMPPLRTDTYYLSVAEEPDGSVIYDRTIYRVQVTSFIDEDGVISAVITGRNEKSEEKTDRFSFYNYVIPYIPTPTPEPETVPDEIPTGPAITEIPEIPDTPVPIITVEEEQEPPRRDTEEKTPDGVEEVDTEEEEEQPEEESEAGEEPEEETSKAPKTGDRTHPAGLMGICTLCIGTVLPVVRKREKKDGE